MKRALTSLLVIVVLAGLEPAGSPATSEVLPLPVGSGSSAASLVPGAPSPLPVAALPSASSDVSVPAIYTASATWCKPTETQCQSWAPPALLGAVNSFRWGDPTYTVRVWRGQRSVDVTIVSFCRCRDSLHAIDLSVAAWTTLEPNLAIGRIDVLVEVLGEGPRVTAPPTSVRP